MKMSPLEYMKAIIAALASFLTALASAADGGITGQEWMVAVAALLISFGAVFQVPNAKPAILRRGKTGKVEPAT